MFVKITGCCGSFLGQIESETSRIRSVSQWKSIRVQVGFQKRIYINQVL